MRFLADENFPGGAVTALGAMGHDVLWVRTECPGESDQTILNRAQLEQRVVLTFDKDFGELAFRSGLPAACGIVLFRVPVTSPGALAETVVGALASRTDWDGQFSVVEPGRIRMTPLPQARG